MIPALQNDETRLTDEQLADAVRKWLLRIDTKTIADQIGVPEHAVYNNLWRIKALSAA